jgi:peptide chain release factor 2
MAEPDFWDDPAAAQKTVGEMKRLKSLTAPFEEVGEKISNLEVCRELAEDDPELQREFDQGLEELEKLLDKLELRLMLSGPSDAANAFVSIQAGAGGTESCDWASMLLRMYLSYFEHQTSFKAELIDSLEGEEAGIRSATILVQGEFAYGYMKAEAGVHRLVRISPFDSASRRHTSFASVDVTPEVEEDSDIEIPESDIDMQFMRAQGAGGQHVNKTSSAVRLVHIPTGITVKCQDQRSQHKNRTMAMKMLKSKLLRQREAEREAEVAKLYGEKGEIAWGSQIRSYVLHPYQMVKDHRTKVETSNTDNVLNGDIQEFIDAWLRSKIGSGKKGG